MKRKLIEKIKDLFGDKNKSDIYIRYVIEEKKVVNWNKSKMKKEK
jgi:hypothetical protein